MTTVHGLCLSLQVHFAVYNAILSVLIRYDNCEISYKWQNYRFVSNKYTSNYYFKPCKQQKLTLKNC